MRCWSSSPWLVLVSEKSLVPREGLTVTCDLWRWRKRTSEQASLWVPTTDLPVSPGHPFYTRLNPHSVRLRADEIIQ